VNVELLHLGPCQVVLAPGAVAAALSGAIEAAVDSVWQQECARRPGLFNGVLLSAVHATAGTLLVRQSQYRHFVAQRRQPGLADELRVNPVAVSGLVVTSDQKWLFGRRGAGVTQYPLHLEAVPSGTLDDRAYAGRPPSEGLALDPVGCLLAELSEEAGIEPAAVAEVCPLGLFLDVAERTYDLAYVIRLQRSSADLAPQLAAVSESHEYQQLRSLDAGQVDALMTAADVVPTTRRLWETLHNPKWQAKR
jgi:hypothetical protein